MRTKQGNTLESLRAVQSFLNTNATTLPTVVATGAKKQLDDMIGQLDTHAGTQTGSTLTAKSATQKHISLREVLLRDHMAPIAKIAAASLPITTEFEPFRMPQGKPTPERLRAAATGMANAAAPYASVFVAAGLPADFIDQLNAAADATTDTVVSRRDTKGIVVGATKGLAVTLSGGRKVVHVLDAFVKSALKDNPSLLATWNTAKRVVKAAVRPKPKAPAPTPTPTATPTPTPTPAQTATPTPSAQPTPAAQPVHTAEPAPVAAPALPIAA